MTDTSRKYPKKHALLSVERYHTLQQYLQELPKSARQTMVKAEHALSEQGYVMQTVSSSMMRFEHFMVIYRHECRYYPRVRALFAAWSRFLVSCLCIGDMDEFRNAKGELIGFAQTVLKGDVLRGMWFYQDGRHKLWFFSLRNSVFRAILVPHVKWVDLGPSSTSNVADAKKRFLFEDTASWPDQCDYDGPFYTLGRTSKRISPDVPTGIQIV